MTDERPDAERTVPAPAAAFVGRRLLALLEFPWSMLLLTVPVAIATVLVHEFKPFGPRWLAGDRETTAFLGMGVAVALSFGLQVWARRRATTVEVFPDRVVLRTTEVAPHSVTFLADLAAYDDRSAALVWLVRLARGARRITVKVPTVTEPLRAALIDALVAAGVPREEGERLPSRPPPAASPPLLVTTGPRLPLELVLQGAIAVVALALVVIAPLLLTIVLPVTLLAVWSRAHLRSAIFRDDRIELAVGKTLTTIAVTFAWDDVVGWRSASTTALVLVPRPGALRSTPWPGWPVPTPTPELRAAVEALLAARGVPRL